MTLYHVWYRDSVFLQWYNSFFTFKFNTAVLKTMIRKLALLQGYLTAVSSIHNFNNSILLQKDN